MNLCRYGGPDGDNHETGDDGATRSCRHSVVKDPLVQAGKALLAHPDAPVVLGRNGSGMVSKRTAAHNATAAAVGFAASPAACGPELAVERAEVPPADEPTPRTQEKPGLQGEPMRSAKSCPQEQD
jgi:hypothetical protein